VISAGLPLAGQQVTLRLDGPVAHILSGATMVRTVACPVPPHGQPRHQTAQGLELPPRPQRQQQARVIAAPASAHISLAGPVPDRSGPLPLASFTR
jgi:hypothetical protein